MESKGNDKISASKRCQATESEQEYILEINPRDAETYCCKGIQLDELGQQEAAIECYKKATERDPSLTEAYINEGAIFHELRKEDEAIQCYRTAIKINPKDAEAYYDLGVTLYKLGRKEEAIDCYRAAIDLNPAFADAYINLGIAFHEVKEEDKAIECYKKAIELSPTDAGSYYDIGIVLHSLGRKHEALEYYKKATEIDPFYVDAYLNQGVVLKELGQLKSAIDCYQRALRINSNHAQGYYNLGIAFNEVGQNKRAVECYQDAIRNGLQTSEVYYNQAIALHELQSREKAAECYRKAIEINPSDSEAYLNLGIVLNELGRREEAIQCYTKAIQLQPRCSEAYYNKGIVLAELGETAEAIECFNRTIEIDPNNLLSYFRIGTLYKNLGKHKEALKNWTTAFSISQRSSAVNFVQEILGPAQNVLDNQRKEIVQKLKDIEKIASWIGEDIKKLDQNNAKVKKIFDTLTRKRKEKDKAIHMALAEFAHPSNKIGHLHRLVLKLEQEYHDLKQKLARLLEKLPTFESATGRGGYLIKIQGTYDQCKIKDSLEFMSKYYPRSFDYCQTFYRTLLTYICAYRILSTESAQTDPGHLEKSKITMFTQGAQLAALASREIFAGIAFLGTISELMETIIDQICKLSKGDQLDRKSEIISLVFQRHSMTVESLSLCIGNISLAITEIRKEIILNPQRKLVIQEDRELSQRYLWLKMRIQELFLPHLTRESQVFREFYSSDEKKLALEDVLLILSYLYKYGEDFNLMESLDEQIIRLFKDQTVYDVLKEIHYCQDTENHQHEKNQAFSYEHPETHKKKSCKGCQIF